MTLIDPNNTQVILIGASEFDFANKHFQNLPNVKTNLLELNRLLIEVLGIDKNKICMMLDKDNSNEITSKIIDVIPKASDTIIVYYAGHGIYHLANFYLATKKTQPKEPEYTGAMPSKHLVNLVIKKAKAKNIIFIIDCCFSARAKEGIDSWGKQVFFITAAPSNQAAKDESPGDASYTAFTHELLLILKLGIENAGEFLTFQDIINHLNKQLTDKNLPEPQLSTHGSPDKLGICKNRFYRRDSSKIPGSGISENIVLEQSFKLSNSFLEEQSGKTVFLKTLFQKYLEQGIYLLMIVGFGVFLLFANHFKEPVLHIDKSTQKEPVLHIDKTTQFVGIGYKKLTVRRTIKEIIIIDTQTGNIESEIRALKEKKFAYHYLIGPYGEIKLLVEESNIAHHTIGRNENSIGIGLIHVSGEEYSSLQLDSLISLLADIVNRHNVRLSMILPKSDFVPKNKSDLPNILSDIREQVETRVH